MVKFMKVLLINGSPNEKGFTYTALSEVEKNLQQEGIETEIISIGKKAIRGCIGCGTCRKTGSNRCVFSDDIVNELLEKTEEADGFVFGSPVYYASPNGSMISLMDRLFFAGSESMKHKPAAVVVSARRAGTSASLEVLSKYINFNEMPMVSSNYWNMVHGSKPEDVLQDEEGMQIMRILGKNIAYLLKCIEAGKKDGIERPVKEAKIKTGFIR